MSNGYWRVGAALAGLAALLIAFGLGVMIMTSHNPEEDRYQPYSYADSKPQGARALPAAETSPKTFPNRTPCEDPKSESESDLCAQWKSANAAEDSAFWTKWGFWVAVVGSSLLLWQIALTREAVKDTGDATKAMVRANELAEDTQRPWIAIDARSSQTLGFSDGKAFYGLEALLKNLGGKVARDVIIETEMHTEMSRSAVSEIVGMLREKVSQNQSSAEYYRRIILPGQQIEYASGVECQSPDEAIYRIIVYLEYRWDGSDVFRYSWATFDLFRAVDNNRYKITRGGTLGPERLSLEASGIGDAD